MPSGHLQALLPEDLFLYVQRRAEGFGANKGHLGPKVSIVVRGILIMCSPSWKEHQDMLFGI